MQRRSCQIPVAETMVLSRISVMAPSLAWKIITRSNARKAVTMPVLSFNPKPRAGSSLRLSGRGFLFTTDSPFAVRKSADVFVRWAQAHDERQMGKLLAPLCGAVNNLITNRCQYKGIQIAHVVDRKNARVCILIFKVVMAHDAHVFKIHGKAEPPGVSNANLEELLAMVRAPRSHAIVKPCAGCAGSSLCAPV